jgi:hypothetical protein
VVVEVLGVVDVVLDPVVLLLVHVLDQQGEEGVDVATDERPFLLQHESTV